MEIGADIHKVIFCVFLASRCPPRQDVLSVMLIMPSCPASILSCQDILLRQFKKCIFLHAYSRTTATPSYASTKKLMQLI